MPDQSKERVHHLQQGEYVHLYILRQGNCVDSVYTHSVQAEADLRFLREKYPEEHWWIQTMSTVPLDNNC